MEKALVETNLTGVPLFHRGKVRDLYALDGRLLIIATDRISAYDYVMPNGIPGKGKILTAMSLFWFKRVEDLVEHHLITAEVSSYPAILQSQRNLLAGRSMLVRRARRIDIECVVRGYLAGSGWREYQTSGAICGIPLEPGLSEAARLSEPLFTPATKATSGHDENITLAEMSNRLGTELAQRLRDLSLAIYEKATAYAETRGIIIADTKFEFGLWNDRIILIDEILSPDSSRFWPQNQYQPGHSQPSFDKQYLRDYLDRSGWNRQPPPPHLPEEVVQQTLLRYQEAYQRLIGQGFWNLGEQGR